MASLLGKYGKALASSCVILFPVLGFCDKGAEEVIKIGGKSLHIPPKLCHKCIEVEVEEDIEIKEKLMMMDLTNGSIMYIIRKEMNPCLGFQSYILQETL